MVEEGRVFFLKDNPDFYSPGTLENLAWKESSLPPDSSSSETGKETPPESTGVHFTVGDGPDEPPSSRGSSKEKSAGIVRSYSQDTNMLLLNEDRPAGSAFLSKTSYSENSLDSSSSQHERQSAPQKGQHHKKLRELPTVMSVDDETLSTDSNSTTADNDELKRRRRKLLFPGFRKNKAKVT